MKELHLGFDAIGELTFPQCYQLSSAIMDRYREQHKQVEAVKVQNTIHRLRHGR